MSDWFSLFPQSHTTDKSDVSMISNIDIDFGNTQLRFVNQFLLAVHQHCIRSRSGAISHFEAIVNRVRRQITDHTGRFDVDYVARSVPELPVYSTKLQKLIGMTIVHTIQQSFFVLAASGANPPRSFEITRCKSKQLTFN